MANVDSYYFLLLVKISVYIILTVFKITTLCEFQVVANLYTESYIITSTEMSRGKLILTSLNY